MTPVLTSTEHGINGDGRTAWGESGEPPTIVSARGARLLDSEGRTWLDARTGGFGSGHRSVSDAVVAQLDRAALSSRTLISRPLAAATAALARFCPAPLDLSYLCSSGDEALDFALKLARGLDPRRRDVVGLLGEDHGDLVHGVALRQGADLLASPPLRARSIDPADPERLLEAVGSDTAAVVLAPAAPGRSLASLDHEWWRALRRRCARTGALLVLDERSTAPARLGHTLGAHAVGIVPDVLVLGEAFGGDAIPVGVTVTSRALYMRVLGDRNPTVHGSTFGANPAAATAVHAVLQAVGRDDLLGRAREAEDLIRDHWSVLDDHRAVAAHHVDGMSGWLRLCDSATARRVRDGLYQRRVLAGGEPGDGLVVLAAPLTADLDDIAQITRAVADVLKELDEGRPKR